MKFRISEKAKKRLISLLLVSSLVLTGCSGNSTKGNGEDEVAEDQYEIVVMNQYGEVVSGARVSIGGASYKTGSYGTVKFNKPSEGTYTVRVTCEDYYDYKATDYKIGSASVGKITIKAKSLSAHRLASAVYTRGLAKKDLVDTYQKINQGTAGWTFSIKATVCGDADTVSAYKLFQRIGDSDKLIGESATGNFENLSSADFSVGTGIFITVYDKAGHETSTSLCLEIAEDPNYTKHTELSLGNETKLKVGDDVPIFGGAELTFGFPSIPLEVEASEDKVHIGFNVDKDNITDSARRDELQKMLNQVKAAKFQASHMSTAIAQIKKKQKKKGVMGMLGFDGGVEVSCCGYAEAGINSDGTISSGTGYLCIAVEAKAEFDWQYIWVVPLTIGIEGKVEANLAGTITYDFEGNKLEGDASLTIAPSLKASLGVGFKYLNVGVYGSAGLETKLIIASLTEKPGFSYLDLNSSIGVYAKAGFFEPECDLAQGTFHLWSRDNSVSKSSAAEEKEAVQLSDFYDLTNYEPVTEADNIKTQAVSEEEKSVLVSDIGSGAVPAVVSNGTDAISVYSVREKVSGTEYAAEWLYYQTCTDDDGSMWSDAVKISTEADDDGVIRCETNPRLCTDGTDYYIVYQEFATESADMEEYTESTDKDTKDAIQKKIWKSVDLHVKKYDVSEEEWVDYGKIETADVYDYNAAITVHDRTIYVYAAANEAGDYFGMEAGENSICLAACPVSAGGTEAEWTVSSEVTELNSVTSLAAGVHNDSVACAYAIDADNDLGTGEQKIFIFPKEEQPKEVCTGSAAAVTSVNGDGYTFAITSGNSFSYIDRAGSKVDIMTGAESSDGNFAITNRGIYFVKSGAEFSEIYGCYQQPDGSYGQPVQVTDEKRWIRGLSAFTLDDRDILVAMTEEYDAKKGVVTSSEIDAFEVSDYQDLSVTGVDYDVDEVVQSSAFGLAVTLKNEGNQKISHVRLNVKDADGEAVSLSGNYYTVDLNPGEEKDVILQVSGQNQAQYGDWTVSADIVATVPAVLAVSGAAVTGAAATGTAVTAGAADAAGEEPEAEEEKTTDNNVLMFGVGSSDFVLNTEICDSGSYPYMLVEVSNEGNRTDSATLKLYNANDKTQKYNSKEISSLKPGQKKMFKINVDSAWADENGKAALLAFVEEASHEIYTYNNYVYQYATMNYGTFSIAYELDGGQNHSSNPATYTTADTITLKNPTKSGYTFGGWYTSADFDVVTKVTEITAGNAKDMVLYAKWTEVPKEEQKQDKDDSSIKDNDKQTSLLPPGTSAKTTTLLKKGTVKKLSRYNAVVKVTASGKIVNGKIKGGKVQYVRPIKKTAAIVIPDKVTIQKNAYKVKSLAAGACKKNKALKKVTMGKNVTGIGKKAFDGCRKLKTIVIKAAGLKTIGKSAVKGISARAVIKVPKAQYKQYKKLFTKKTGFGKKMKVKKI